MKLLALLSLVQCEQRSDEEIATAEKVCPSSNCWTYNEQESKCEAINSEACFKLECKHDGVAISFAYTLFGGSSTSPEIDLYDMEDVDDIAFDNANPYYPYTMNCEFDQCGFTSSMESADDKKTLNVKTTVVKNDADPVGNLDIGNLVLKRKVNSISMVFECVYSAEISLDEVAFDVKKADVEGLVSGQGDLKGSFELIVSGTDYIGDTRNAAITWKQGSKFGGIQFIATECKITHGDVDVYIMKDTCISNALIGKAVVIPSASTHNMQFSWMTFMIESQQATKQQSLSCEILICDTNDADCAFKPDDSCPDTESDSEYEFEEFKIVDMGR